MTIYLEADTINGITSFDYADLTPDMDFMDLVDFADELGGLDDGEVIRAVVTDENDPVYRMIIEDYQVS